MSLGTRLKSYRLKNKESLQEVADSVSVSKAHIWELESGGSKNPSLELLKNLAAHFKISVATLVGESISDADEADIVMFRDLKGLSPEEQKFIADVIETMKMNAKKKGSDNGEVDQSDRPG